mmetsp:Transcript_1936/g.4251  ORF Transcript_1936/g.4251 Transcript_1936/m.4251 type:complete len:88 (-) Transcript_1936:123-386(-)
MLVKNPVPHRASLFGLRAKAGLGDSAAVDTSTDAEAATTTVVAEDTLRNISRRVVVVADFGWQTIGFSGTSDEVDCNVIAVDKRSRG